MGHCHGLGTRLPSRTPPPAPGNSRSAATRFSPVTWSALPIWPRLRWSKVDREVSGRLPQDVDSATYGAAELGVD